MKFALVFAALFVLQLTIWHELTIIDQGVWVQRVLLHEQNLAGLPLATAGADFTHSNSPNLSVLTLSVAVKQFRVSATQALFYSLSFFIALGAALASYTAYKLEPKSTWWAVVAVIIGFSHLIFSTSPPSAVATALISWLLVATLYAWQKPDRESLTLFGLAVGLSLLTRWPAAVIVAGPLGFLLLWRLGLRKFTPAIVSFLVSTIVIAPFVLTDPISLFKVMFVRSLYNFDPVISNAVLDVPTLTLNGLIALISICLAVMYVFKGENRSIKIFVATLLGMTAVYAIAFSSIAAPALRHWYPLILGWEILLPYWVVKLVPQNVGLQAATNGALALGSIALTISFL